MSGDRGGVRSKGREVDQVDRAHVVVSGVVQGVCFRYETRAEAERLGVRGWVRNFPNGDVEGRFEGDRASVEALVEWCRHGPPSARVRNLGVRWSTGAASTERFEIRF